MLCGAELSINNFQLPCTLHAMATATVSQSFLKPLILLAPQAVSNHIKTVLNWTKLTWARTNISLWFVFFYALTKCFTYEQPTWSCCFIRARSFAHADPNVTVVVCFVLLHFTYSIHSFALLKCLIESSRITHFTIILENYTVQRAIWLWFLGINRSHIFSS